jgi:hypothetical protein
MYDLALDQQGTCPAFAVGTVSGRLQEVYGQAQSGVLILDQTTDCIAGRYDATVGVALDNGTFANEGEVSGWFSVPL